MVSYEPLWQTMKKKNITTYTLIEKYGINARTVYNLKHNKGITVDTLEKSGKQTRRKKYYIEFHHFGIITVNISYVHLHIFLCVCGIILQ